MNAAFLFCQVNKNLKIIIVKPGKAVCGFFPGYVEFPSQRLKCKKRGGSLLHACFKLTYHMRERLKVPC
jgi:hypothetical protein